MRGAGGLLLAACCLISARATHGKIGELEQLDSYNKLLEVIREFAEEEINNELASSYAAEAEAKEWLVDFNSEYRVRLNEYAVAEFEYTTNITKYNEEKYSEAEMALNEWLNAQIEAAVTYREAIMVYGDEDVSRMLKLIVSKREASSDQQLNKEITDLRNSITEIYNTAKPEGEPLDYHENIMAHSRDWGELLGAWLGWRDVTGPPMRQKYSHFVTLQNDVMKDNGWKDTGEFWRVTDFEEDNVEEMTAELYEGILPLYTELHTYVRRKLIESYPNNTIDPRGPIPAHLLGNMWAQDWENIMDLVKPYPNCADVDVTPQLKEKGYTARGLFGMAEEFFTSLGLEEMTDTFWEKTMMVRPKHREVQCHASATDLYAPDDFRIKMCTYITGGDVYTIHHEMGHIEYFMEYAHQPAIYRRGANAAFHEAIGDTVALSVSTPQHFQTIGLINSTTTDGTCEDTSEADINFLMKVALLKIGFLPFGYLIDKYRWEIFRGNINDTNYNAKWWEMREEIQGVSAPVQRSESDFDAGAKFHVAAHVPYLRYFLAHIGQFQFFKAMCDASGHPGPLHTCDFYGSHEAGALLKSMLSMGSSRPWPEAMVAMTGQWKFTSDAIFEYFRPLYDWLQDQNIGEHKGWRDTNMP